MPFYLMESVMIAGPLNDEKARTGELQRFWLRQFLIQPFPKLRQNR